MIERIYAAPKYIEVEDGIEFAVQNGISYEIPTFMSPAVLDNKQACVTEYLEKLKNVSGEISLHGPVYDMNPVSLEPGIAETTRKRYRQAVEACSDLGARFVVFHSQYTPIYTVAKVYKEWIAASTDYWQEIIETKLEGSKTVILMENFMDDKPDILNELLDKVNSPHFKACLDTGHANLFSKIPSINWLDEMGSNIVYIHAHNNHGKEDEHNAFHKGNIDMEGFMNHLALLPNKVNLAIEVFNLEGVHESYDFIQPYLKVQEEYSTSRSFLI